MATIAESKDTKAQEPTKASEQPVVDPTPDNASTVSSNAEITESEFNRDNIDALGNRIRTTDKDEEAGLELLCYVRCGPDDGPLLRQCRGVVFHGKEIVMHAFPYTVEYTESDKEQIKENIEPVFDQCSFFDSYEGALIRVFHFSGRWYTSTHRKLNAFRSKWASRESFGTCFKRALESEVSTNSKLSDSIPGGDEGLLERFQGTLDKSNQYMFLVRHTEENRIVSAAPETPTLFHVGTFINGELSLDYDINIPCPSKHSFKDMEELVGYVKGVDIRDLQGVICFAPDNKQYKFIHRDYQDLFRARGNEPSVKFRYLQVRMNRRFTDMLFHLYPKWEARFDEIENTIYDIARNIYTAYVQRFIKKRFVTVPTEEFTVIRECHKWHEEDRTNNRISIERVIEALNQQSPTSLNRMIRRFRNEKTAQTQNKTDAKQRVRSNTISSVNSPSLTATVGSPPVQSPLLLSQNRQRNPALPPSPNLGPSALPPRDEGARSLL
jgi:hypothetical protein